MDYNKIKALLDKYYAGEASSEEEAELREYFKKEDVAPELEPEKQMFNAYSAMRKESQPEEGMNDELLNLIEEKWQHETTHKFRETLKWTLSAAAGLTLLIGTYLMYYNSSKKINDTYLNEQEAYLATKQVLFYVSETMNAEYPKLSGISYINKGLSSMENLSRIDETIENLKTEKKMKTILACLMIVLAANTLSAQNSPVDRLFDKYADKNGFTSVFISKQMFELFAAKDMASRDSEEYKNALSGIKSIKILTVEDSVLNRSINFFKEIGKEIPLEEYSTLMVIKEKNQDLRMMVREKNGKITEFLMLGGGNDNVLISIVGELDLNSISKISKAIDLQGLDNLEQLDKK